MLFGKRKRNQENIRREVNPIGCTERLSEETVEIVSAGYKVEERETEPVYPDCEKELEDISFTDGNPCFTFVKEKLTEEHEAYLSTVLSDLSHLKYGFWVDKQNKTYFYETGSQVHDCLEFYTLLYKGTCYHVTTEYLLYSREYDKCVMIPSTNRQGEDVYREIKAVVTEIFRCMYGHPVKLCFSDNPKFKSLRSNM